MWNNAIIDLRSDTATRPSAGMRKAIADAEVGDEQRREDPSVTLLEARVAAMLGQEAAVFLPTATMANQIALRIHRRRGEVLLAESTSHILLYEYGGAAAHSGLMPVGLQGRCGLVTPEQISAAARPSAKAADQRVAVLVLENTHNSAGGRVWPLDALESVVNAARDRPLAVHLDGARLLNAAVAQGVPPLAIAAQFDTVTLCLSKGLGCPLGALLAGPKNLIELAWREKHLFGGAMRQAGVIAAAGLYALAFNVDRLLEDHVRAQRLAQAWAAEGVPIDPEQVQTNFVHIDTASLRLSRDEALRRLLEAGVALSPTIHPSIMRAVTHLDVKDAEIEQASEVVPRVLGPNARR